MSNSTLVSYTKISPNKTSPRQHKIDTITIHCVAGQCSVETLGDIFAPTSRKASCNYGIGPDGRIGMYVEESDRSWCSSNGANDHRAITIEVASDAKHPYAVKAAAYKSLINLLVDICKRNGISELKWKGDKSLIGQPDKQNMTVHRWFDNKDCPGEYLYSRHAKIAAEVNTRLGNSDKDKTISSTIVVKEGDIVKLARNACYYNGSDIPNWVINKKWVVKDVSGDRAVIDRSTDGTNSINSPVHVKYLTVVESKPKSFMVKIDTSNLNIRKGPGINYATTGKYTGKGVFTVTEVKMGSGSKAGWGRLKSGEGWISLDYAKRI